MNEELAAFGERLRAARTDLDLTLEEVEKATRIRRRFLENFENGTLDTTLTAMQVHGFLRNYARHLKLDPDEIIAGYEQAKAARNNQSFLKIPFRRTDIPEPEPPRESSVPVMVPAIAGTQIPPEEVSASRQIVRIMLYGVLTLVFIGMLGVGANLILKQIRGADGDNQAANPPLLTDPAQQFPAESPTITPTPSPTPSATQGGIVMPPPIPNTGQGLAIYVSATARSWVQVTVDGVIQYSGILRPGTALQYQANDSITLLTGNAGGLAVSINGTPLGSLGAMGARYQDTFTLSDLETPSSLIPPSSTAALDQSDTTTAPENGADLFLATPGDASTNDSVPIVTFAPSPLAPPPTIGPPTSTPTMTLTPSVTPTQTPDLPERVTRTPRPG